MPEGDTIHRIARALQQELEGRVIDRLMLRDHGDVTQLAGCRVVGVDALGKHLLVHIDGGWTLRVHLGMHGTWRRRHVGEAAPRAPTVVIESGDRAFDCDRAYTAELLRSSGLGMHGRLRRLGPDLLADPPDIDEAVRRASLPAYAGREVGDVLLDQRIAAGVGNVYKSEVMFECRLHPRTRLQHIERGELAAMFTTAARLMRDNLLTRRRTSVPLRRRPSPSSQRLWVYGRAGKPCLECGTAIQRFLQGDMARSTYWCPQCQAGSQ
ncbi:Fpg/Nei family DNA glycosylase [soil metagenome]